MGSKNTGQVTANGVVLAAIQRKGGHGVGGRNFMSTLK